ncbi:MAG: chromate resistance protein ChrB [Clostridia bacterium]|nr:MAG: chromate resistance protein ChrB [Clostridia bacterium]
MTEAGKWLILIYKIPAEPSRYRVAVWRRLKERGAVYLQNSVCVLPDTPANRNLFHALAEEIVKAEGESLLLLAEPLGTAAQEKVVGRFNGERDAEYGEFLEQCGAFLAEIRRETERRNFTFGELEENEEGLRRLETWLQKIKNRDFFGAMKAAVAEDYLSQCQQALETFAGRVFLAQEGSGPE